MLRQRTGPCPSAEWLTRRRLNLKGADRLDDAEQAVDIWQRVFQRAVEDRDLVRNLLAPGAFIIFVSNSEIVA